jgi:hypothetical protein
MRPLSRRTFLNAAGAAAACSLNSSMLNPAVAAALAPGKAFENSFVPFGRIVDMHVHFRPDEPGFVDNLLKLADRINLTACLLTPFIHREIAVAAARQHPQRIIPFGAIKLDAPDVIDQVKELHSLGYRGLGEISSMKKNCSDPQYFPV